MIDAAKYPKAAQLQRLREQREEARLKLLKDVVAIKPRSGRQHNVCVTAAKKIAAKRKAKKC